MIGKDKVLIADDDPNIRNGLAKAVENTFGEHMEILVCENGAEASLLLKDNTVDIVITDIKMPFMSGIDLLKFIKEEKLYCKSVVLSGYDDYNLVRDALRLGAADYLLKPVDFGLLSSTVRSLLTTLQLEKQTSPHLQKNTFHMQTMLEYFLLGRSTGADNTDSFLHKYQIAPDSACAIAYMNTPNTAAGSDYELQNAFTSSVCEYLEDRKLPFSVILSGKVETYWVFLIIGEDFQSSFPSFLPLFETLEKRYPQVYCCPQYFLMKSIKKVHEKCLKELEQLYYDLPYAKIPGDRKKADIASLLERAVAAASEYNYARFMEVLTSVFAFFSHTKPPAAEVKKIMSQMIYDLISKNPKYIQPISSSKFTEYDIFDQIETAASLSILQKNIFSSVNHYIEQLLCTLTDREDRIIRQAKEYIKSNYNDNISLDDIAAHVFLHSNYFSSLFKAKTGTTYRHYLRNFRIEKAKQLMLETDMRVYEIAQAVGYNDSAHFVRAFKEITGISPSEFKKSRQGL